MPLSRTPLLPVLALSLLAACSSADTTGAFPNGAGGQGADTGSPGGSSSVSGQSGSANAAAGSISSFLGGGAGKTSFGAAGKNGQGGPGAGGATGQPVGGAPAGPGGTKGQAGGAQAGPGGGSSAQQGQGGATFGVGGGTQGQGAGGPAGSSQGQGAGAAGPGGSSQGQGAGGNSCGLSTGQASCDACLNASCCSESSACANEPQCLALLQCVGQCASGDQTCANNCGSQSQQGIAPYNALGQCVQSGCNTPCSSGGQGGSPQGQGGSPQGQGAGGSGTGDPWEQARKLCVDTINMYRATRSLPPLQRGQSSEMCVDGQATNDGMMNSAHQAFISGNTCGASAQDECPGYGPDAINQLPVCLQLMWNEKDRPVCTGCDTCEFPYMNCTNCTFEGTNGTDGCGHYLNMKSTAFTSVSCGFWSGGWYAQDFQ